MKIFYATNLTTQTMLCEALPWEFKPTEKITQQIRHDKETRQEWYRTISTRHYFYTTIEAANRNQRASREDNPPRWLHGIAADYDIEIPDARIDEGIAAMPIKPAWIERSLGRKTRLVWSFPNPLPVDSYEFCSALLQAAIKWLRLDLLPGLDEPAFTDPTRLLCNGCDWRPTGAADVPNDALQGFFVECGKQFRFGSSAELEIPLDVIAQALSKKYPNFCWPGEFALETSGPSFWIPESQSSNSAILKKDGFFTFSAHATKPFYTWADILGPEFVKEYQSTSVAKATQDIWFDGHKFWRRKKGDYVSMELTELNNYFKVDCGLPTKGKHLEGALSHIYNEKFVENASPYVFRPHGLIVYQGKRRLNTSTISVIPPAAGSQQWGESGEFPFLSSLFDNIFTSEIQRDHFLAWFQYFYQSGLNLAPAPGHVVFLMGGVATGKTFTSREVVGRAVGGYIDSGSYIIRGADFNSHLFEYPLWVMDDDTISDSPQAAANVQTMLKKTVANNAFLSNKKFQVAGMVEWQGRVIATTNTDYISSRMLGPLDNSSLDKISVYRCQQVSKIKFPSRTEMEKLVSQELPYLLRWLDDWTPPDYIERDTRFGYKSWHESTLMQQAGQTSKSAPFKEVLIEALDEFFENNPEETIWSGTVSKLIQLIHFSPMRECVIKTLRLEQVSRYLENIEKDGSLQCYAETGPQNTRIWRFPRLNNPAPDQTPELPPTAGSNFTKP